MVKTFTFYKKSYATLHSLSFLNVFFIWCAGKNITADLPGSTQVNKGGLFLLISPVKAAHQGEYTCLVKGDTTEILRTYKIYVDGEQTTF